MDKPNNYLSFTEIRGIIWHCERSGRDGMNAETKRALDKLKSLLPTENKQEKNADTTSKPTTARKRPTSKH